MQKIDFNLVVNRIKSYNLFGVSKTIEKHKNSITKKWLGINKMFGQKCQDSLKNCFEKWLEKKLFNRNL